MRFDVGEDCPCGVVPVIQLLQAGAMKAGVVKVDIGHMLHVPLNAVAIELEVLAVVVAESLSAKSVEITAEAVLDRHIETLQGKHHRIEAAAITAESNRWTSANVEHVADLAPQTCLTSRL